MVSKKLLTMTGLVVFISLISICSSNTETGSTSTEQVTGKKKKRKEHTPKGHVPNAWMLVTCCTHTSVKMKPKPIAESLLWTLIKAYKAGILVLFIKNELKQTWGNETVPLTDPEVDHCPIQVFYSFYDAVICDLLPNNAWNFYSYI